MNKALGIILLLVLVGGLLVAPYQMKVAEAQETITKPMLVIWDKNNVEYDQYNPTLWFHVDNVNQDTINYTKIGEYKVIFISPSVKSSASLNFTAFKENLVAGQVVVVMSDLSCLVILQNVLGWSVSTTYYTLSGTTTIVVNGTSDLVGWLSGKVLTYPYVSGVSTPYINISASTITTPYQVIAYVTNGTTSFPAVIYVEDNGVKYFFIWVRYYTFQAWFLANHFTWLYAGDGLAFGSMPTPFMFVVKCDDSDFLTDSVPYFIDLIQTSKLKYEFSLTMGDMYDVNNTAFITALRDNGLLEKNARILIHGWLHYNYITSTYEQWYNNITLAIQKYKSYGLNEPIMWTSPHHSLNYNGLKAMIDLGIFADIEDFDDVADDVKFLKAYHGEFYNNTIGILDVKVWFAYDNYTMIRNENIFMVMMQIIYTSGGKTTNNIYDVFITHSYHLDPYDTRYNPTQVEWFKNVLSYVYNIPAFSHEILASFIPEARDHIPTITVTYNLDGSITFTSNMTCWIKIKGTWWHKDGLPAFHGTDGYGDWTIALLEPGANTFYKTVQKPSITYMNAKLKSMQHGNTRIDIVVSAPKNYRAEVVLKTTKPPYWVYAYYKALPQVNSLTEFNNANFDCWYYDPVTDLLYIKATAHSDIPITVLYYNTLLDPENRFYGVYQTQINLASVAIIVLGVTVIILAIMLLLSGRISLENISSIGLLLIELGVVTVIVVLVLAVLGRIPIPGG